jgi:hypothetical protein
VSDTRQPRRPAQPRRPERSADDAEIVDLINNVRSARISLSADLSAAAGALEAGQLEVARDILAADQRDLAGFATDTKQSLADHSPTDRTVPEPRRPRRGRTRLLLALPAIPLVGGVAITAAAALGSAGHANHHRAATTAQHPSSLAPVTTTHAITPLTAPTADSTLQRLEHVVRHHPKAAQVLAVANDLHQQLTQMIASSKNNPQQLGVVRQLLNLEQQVLEGNNAPGSTVALAASRQIAQLLSQLPTANSLAPTTTPTSTKPPSSSATTPSTTPKSPTATTTSRATKHHPKTTPSASNQPKKTPSPFDPLHFPNVFDVYS